MAEQTILSSRRFTIYCWQIEALAASIWGGDGPEINSRKGSIVIQQLNCTSAESGARIAHAQSSPLISVIGCAKWGRIAQPRVRLGAEDGTCGNSPGARARAQTTTRRRSDNDVRLMSRRTCCDRRGGEREIMTKRGQIFNICPAAPPPSLADHVITLVRSTQSGVIFCVGLSRKSMFLIHCMNQI